MTEEERRILLGQMNQDPCPACGAKYEVDKTEPMSIVREHGTHCPIWNAYNTMALADHFEDPDKT